MKPTLEGSRTFLPKMAFVVLDAVLNQKLPVFFLKRPFSVMPFVEVGLPLSVDER